MTIPDQEYNLWPLGAPEDWGKEKLETEGSVSTPIVAPEVAPSNTQIISADPLPAASPSQVPPTPPQIIITRPRNDRPDPAQKQYMAEKAFSEIIVTSKGLCVLGKSERLHCVFQREFQRCIKAIPDVRYSEPNCYYIYFSGTYEPLIISEQDFDNPKKLSKALSQHFHTPVKHFDSKSKTESSLHSFLVSETKEVEIFYYFGWTIEDDNWRYLLWNGKVR